MSGHTSTPAPAPAPIEVSVTSPRDADVLIGRRNHPGNIVYRSFVESAHERYLLASNKKAKSDIAQEVVDKVREQGGWFLQKQIDHEAEGGGGEGRWVEMDEERARKKVARNLWLLGTQCRRAAGERVAGDLPDDLAPAPKKRKAHNQSQPRESGASRPRTRAPRGRDRLPPDDPLRALLDLDPVMSVVRAEKYGALDRVEKLARSLIEHATAIRVLNGEKEGTEVAGTSWLLADDAGSEEDVPFANPQKASPRRSRE